MTHDERGGGAEERVAVVPCEAVLSWWRAEPCGPRLRPRQRCSHDGQRGLSREQFAASGVKRPVRRGRLRCVVVARAKESIGCSAVTVAPSWRRSLGTAAVSDVVTIASPPLVRIAFRSARAPFAPRPRAGRCHPPSGGDRRVNVLPPSVPCGSSRTVERRHANRDRRDDVAGDHPSNTLVGSCSDNTVSNSHGGRRVSLNSSIATFAVVGSFYRALLSAAAAHHDHSIYVSRNEGNQPLQLRILLWGLSEHHPSLHPKYYYPRPRK